jgi:radical SAM superfamily enzyme with C-terminal helix-hairpin-helix motif
MYEELTTRALKIMKINKRKLLAVVGTLYTMKIIVKVIRWKQKMQKFEKFINGKKDQNMGRMGIFAVFKNLMTNNEAFIEYRMENYKINGNIFASER